MDQIVKCYQMHDYELAIATAQEAMQHFGQCTGYLYYLALAQRNAGYTGKSVRNLELLVERKPEVPAFSSGIGAFSAGTRIWEKGDGSF